ncbi:MAG: glycosyltransferase [Actinomycetia bacterium]|nr:glycosyltransferase [Actinomycetes bacterium]
MASEYTRAGTGMLSVVVPMYNEAQALPHFTARLRPVLDGLPVPYEVVCVDDGSKDGTALALQAQTATWEQLRVVRLRRNAGHQAALTAGLDNSRGDWVVTIDADLQDPPEVIPEMLQAAITTRADVVYGVRADRKSDTLFKRVSAAVYYRIIRRAAGVDLPRHAGDFRLLSGDALRELAGLQERGRVYRLLIPYMGFASAEVTYRREARVAGKSKYRLAKMVRLATDSYVSFTTAPLRFATWLGLVGFVLCLAFTVTAFVAHFTGSTLPGWTSVAIVLGFSGAVQFLFLGLLGEYVARIYSELQARPRYFGEVQPSSVRRGPDPSTDAPAFTGGMATSTPPGHGDGVDHT